MCVVWMCISRFCVLEQVIVESEFNSSTAVLTRFWTIWFATFATNAIFIQRNTILEIVTTFGSRIMSVPFTPEDKKYTITNRYLFFSISDTYNGSLWHISKQASGVSALATLIKTPVHLINIFFVNSKLRRKIHILPSNEIAFRKTTTLTSTRNRSRNIS